ncbi:flagellar motor protein MotB [Roseobacter ponti]|uniref:Chemotaxis protein MotB n=1 Tax=Roseobacter ponti TaxID=1891787 RepID=A0A858SVG1_9RHOB|nr:flagellar motor protein MotB [Roseobacter ponti]QJF52959.1 chemotaxis protein MotB [Roseobacter ponti]
MGAQSNLAPVIIKRKKVIAAGHHGGAWKVAYADFVTAMMAFFMMMWLLNATTEQQRSGLADYFSPTVPINRISGGGDGNFGGDSMMAEDTLPQTGTGATAEHSTIQKQSRGQSGMTATGGDLDQAEAALKALMDELMGRGGESTVMNNLLEHIVTRITDEGLVIELFSTESARIFEAGTAEPTQLLRDLTDLVASVAQTVTNPVAIGGHVQSSPIVVAKSPVWDISSDRADQIRLLIEQGGVATGRVHRVTGHADRELADDNPMAARNERVEIVLLR